MTTGELEQFIKETHKENEHVEFKSAKNNFSVLGKDGDKRIKKSLLGYCVALGNELTNGFARIVFGVDNDRNIVGTQALQSPSKIKSQMFREFGARVSIEEHIIEGKRVVLVEIPARKYGETYKFYGTPLMRVDEELVEMDVKTQRSISEELMPDFSAKIVQGLLQEDLDPLAVKRLRELCAQKEVTTDSDEQLLIDLHLKENGGLTYAALVLLGSESAIRKYLSNAEIIFQYRNDRNNVEAQDRDYYKRAFLLYEQDLWNKINARNDITQLQEGFLTKEIPSFNEKVVKEAILNAITHRDYTDPASVIVKQSPQEMWIQSPGGFLQGVTPENIIDATKPRNRRIAEVLQHLSFVQRAGQGVDTIFRETIEEGKGRPDYAQSDEHQVTLSVPAQVVNKSFIQFLEKVSQENNHTFALEEIILLQDIENGKTGYPRKEIQKFLDLGIIEQVGRTRGIKYVLSRKYYIAQGKVGTYTKITGLSRDVKKELILKHLKDNRSGAGLGEFADAFLEMKSKDISNLLQELRREGKIYNEGKRRNAIWKLAKE